MKNFFKIFRGFKFRTTIGTKFIIVFTLMVGIISAFIYAYFPLKFEKQAIKSTADKAQSIIAVTAFNISSTLLFEDKRDMENILESVKQDRDIVYLLVYNSKGEVFSEFNYQTAVRVDYEFPSNKNPISEDELIYRTMTPIIHNKKQIGMLFLGISLENLRSQVASSRATIASVSSVIFVLGVLVVFFISTVITRPLKKMVRTIEEISSGDLSRRATFSSNDEVGNLAASFNLMVENLETYSSELQELNINLENKVVERTKELQVEINERKLTQEALEKSEEKYRQLVNNSLVGIYITQDHFIKFCNQKFAEIFGYQSPEEVLGKQMKELLIKEKWSKATRMYEFKGIKKDGTIFDIEVLDTPIIYQHRPAIQGILMDITIRKQIEEERQKLEDQLRQAQKMESLGTLAGGIAHDFNNILSAILGYTELTMAMLTEKSKAKSNLSRVLSASHRAKEMVKHILTFSRRSEKDRKPLWLNEVVNEVLKLMRSTLPSTIEINQDVPEMTMPVIADRSEIHQVVMNLCTNAGHAMREKGGILHVALKEIEYEAGTIGRSSLVSGRYQQLTISDTGHGMSPEILSRIFEPYFTTKREGEGIGMGLAVVHGIIKSCEGDITVYSQPGKGTTFNIFLPVTEEKEMKTVIDQTEIELRGSEHILFIDDEPILAELGVEMLEHFGYKVKMITSSIKALEAFRAAPGKFDLVITDQTMPNMTGLQLAVKIREVRPDIPIILCTGFSESVNEENFKAQGIQAFLMKPFIKEELARVIRNVLDGK
ncbi:MAG: response regulator [Candidatus Aminicenantes bacterium]|nr:response regulator [Candidatus Aminicenantes bacterium]NIM84801.1 response regulator [Candidatus Aminicenantes bacterium]NIN24304.1 response regulator [Candidatus Aminicenantes bacterium]NIN48063.1 response regulator [Candidatus Aminicenantes bacterium]NIN90964.1 response regulator [Candidatus Aminicenantes bacterium]